MTVPRHRNGLLRVLCVALWILAALALLPKVAAAADLVGDEGARSLSIDSSTILLGRWGLNSTGGPVAAVTVARDGSLSVPADALGGQLSGALPQGSLTDGGVTMTYANSPTHSIALTGTLVPSAAAAGSVDPATGLVQLTVPATLTRSSVAVPVTYSSPLGSGSVALNCTIDDLPMTLHLAGSPSNGTSPATGALHLVDSAVTGASTVNCSGGGILGDALVPLLTRMSSELGSAAGSANLSTTLTPGVHAPSAPSFGGAPVVTGTPAVGQTLTCAAPSVTGLPAPAVTLSWLRDGTPVAGGGSYVVQDGDAGHSIACAAKALNFAGTLDSTSGALAIPVPDTGAETPPAAGDATPPTPEVTPPIAVPPPLPLPPPPALALTAFTQSAKTWKTRAGTTFGFRLTRAAKVQLVFTRVETGRNVRGRCVAQTSKNKRSKSCTRLLSAGTLSVAGRGGANTVRFAARLPGQKKALAPGYYQLVLTATDGASRVSSLPLKFRIAA